MIIFLSFLVLLALTIRFQKKNRGLGNAGVLLLATYSFTLLGAFCLTLVEDREVRWDATLFFLTVLLLFTLPLISKQPATLDNCPAPTWKPVYGFVAWPVALLSCYSTITTLPAAARLLLSGRLGEVREAVYQGNSGMISDLSFSSLAASGLWSASLSFFFVVLISSRSLPLLFALGIGSLSGTTASLVVAGRSGLVYLGLQIVLLLVLTWPLLIRHRPRLRTQVTVAGVIGLGAITLLTIFIAFTRNIGNVGAFSAVSNNPVVNTFYSLLIYSGSPIVNFQEFWFIYDDFGVNLLGQKCFPVYCGILERFRVIGDYEASEFLRIYKPFYDAYNLEHAVFNGFQRELMMDFGRGGTLGGSVLWAIAAVLVRRRYERQVDWFSIASMAFFASVPLQGIFFLSYAEIHGNVSLAAMLATMGFFWLTGRSTREPQPKRPTTAQNHPPVILSEVPRAS